MNTYELNKVFGAILFAGLTAMTAWLISLAAYGKLEHGHHERVIHYEVAGLEQDDAMHDEAEADEPEMPAMSVAELLADADPAKGQRVFKKCAACHTADEGGKNKVGPNLWNIVNRPIASHEGFNFSDAMAAEEGVWDFERLNIVHLRSRKAPCRVPRWPSRGSPKTAIAATSSPISAPSARRRRTCRPNRPRAAAPSPRPHSQAV